MPSQLLLADDPAALEAILRKANPTLRLVKERHMLRALRILADDGVSVPPGVDWPVSLERRHVAELDLFPRSVLEGTELRLLLVTDPDDRGMYNLPDTVVLRHYWGLLFRATVRDAIAKNTDAVRVWKELPDAVRVEADFVLQAEHLVSDEAGTTERVATLAAEVLFLQRFDVAALPYMFPLLSSYVDVLRTLATLADADAIFESTRPVAPTIATQRPQAKAPPTATSKDEALAQRYVVKAEVASRTGNWVRAAIRFTSAANACQSGAHLRVKEARAAIANEFVPRLAAVMGWDKSTQYRWAKALQPLLAPASRGIWPASAKALYELQCIVSDHDRDIYAIDPAAWARSLGSQPLLRKLDIARTVIHLRHLRAAIRCVRQTTLAETDRETLAALLQEAVEASEQRLRQRVEPVLREVFEEVGLRPTNPVEEVARDKLVAELIDAVCERGFIRLAGLRDAIARNRLKLQDLSGPVQLLVGDALLQADRRLGERLDGVYRPGEIYLRWIQRGSSMAFGTLIGRWLMLFLVLPCLAALMTFEFAKYLKMEGGKIYSAISGLVTYQDEDWEEYGVEVAPPPPKPHGHEFSFGPESFIILVILTLFFLGLIHSSRVRRVTGQSFSAFGRLIRFALWTLPLTLWQSAPVRAVRNNPVSRLLFRRFGAALIVAIVVALVFLVFEASWTRIGRAGGLAFLITALATNTRMGRLFQDRTDEFFSDTWRSFTANFLPGLYTWTVWFFRELLGGIDRLLYTIDEWLRFREGQSKPSLVLKVILGLIWFPIAYLVRFAFFLLIEPQVNPVKHFPVVTVSHKLLLTQIHPLSLTVVAAMHMSMESAIGLVTLVFACIPGVFGFIVWELKENWRLYAANRPKRLAAVPLGHHGETMRGLLRPGFHSGTVPNLYRKLRKLIVRAEREGEPAVLTKPLEGLHQVQHAIHQFVDRELLAVLQRDASFNGVRLTVHHIDVCVQSISISVKAVNLDGGPAVITFTHHSGVISGSVTESGWTMNISPTQRESWDVAIAGFLAMGAVPSDSPWIEWPRWVEFWTARQKG